MTFSIHNVAKEYVYRRYPNATVLEKEKYVKDWDNKIKDSESLVKDFVSRVGDPKGKKILDAGCGNGGVSIAFSLAGAETHGVEIEEDLYSISKAHAASFNLNPNFYLYDGNKLPFESDTFDYAISVSVLEHTDDPRAYLREILRVLKRGGVLYLGFPNKLTPRETHTQLLFLTYLPSFLKDFYIKLFRRNPLADNNLHFYSYFDLEKMLLGLQSDYKSEIIIEDGQSTNLIKKSIKKILKIFGLPYRAFLPHILVLIRKK